MLQHAQASSGDRFQITNATLAMPRVRHVLEPPLLVHLAVILIFLILSLEHVI